MKTVVAIRHGKSSWDHLNLSDIDRPLKERGKRDAKIIGGELLNSQVLPKEVFSSPAKRAYSTCQMICEILGFAENKISIDKRLYFTGVKSIMNVIHDANDYHDCIFLFGHNPDMTQLANHFSEHQIDNVPTTGMLVISFNVDEWRATDYHNGKLELFDYPSNHR